MASDGDLRQAPMASDQPRSWPTPEPYMARAGLMTTAAVIRSAAQETGKSEDEILAELRRSLAA
jgi:hypothetical protein